MSSNRMYSQPTVVVTPDPYRSVVADSPVYTREPVAYLRSLDYKIEDVEGQCVGDWFRNEFGAKNTVEFHAKVKGAAGRAKAKVVLEPNSSKKTIGVKEDIEIQTDIDYGVQGLLKIKEKEISAQFDFGLKPVATNWFNPYVVFRLPRKDKVCRYPGSIGFGGVFHFDSYLRRRGKHQFEVDIGFGDEKKNDITIRQNVSFWYQNFIFGWYEAWKLTNGFSRDGKLSAAYHDGPIRAYGQLEVDNELHLTSSSAGASYKINPDVKVFVQSNQPLKKDGKPFSFGAIDLGAGVEFSHNPSGVGVKLGYFHSQKIASALTFKLNKYFSGSLLFDVKNINDRN